METLQAKRAAAARRRRKRNSLWIGCIGGLLVIIVSSLINQHLHNAAFLNIMHTVGTVGLLWWFYEWFWRMPPSEK